MKEFGYEEKWDQLFEAVKSARITQENFLKEEYDEFDEGCKIAYTEVEEWMKTLDKGIKIINE